MRLSRYIALLAGEPVTGTATGPTPLRCGDPRDSERNDAPWRVCYPRKVRGPSRVARALEQSRRLVGGTP